MRNQHLASVVWSTASAACSVLVPFTVMAVFARLLSPAEIGLVALNIAMLELLKALAPQGLYEVLVQQGDENPALEGAALTAWLASAVLLMAAFWIFVAIQVRWTGETIIPGAVLALLGVKALFDLPVLQPQARLARRMDFRRMSARTVVSNIGSAALSFALAWILYPALGLVLYYVFQSTLTFAFTAWGGVLARPSSPRALKGRVGEGLYASAVRLVGVANNYLDQLIVAPLASTAALGVYNLSKRVELVFVTLASTFGANLFQPIFAQQGDRTAACRRAIAVLTALCGLPAAVTVVARHEVVLLLFGAKWADAAAPVAALAVSGAARAYGQIHGALLSVTGRNRALLGFSLSSSATGLGLVAVLAQVSVTACALALAVKNTLFLVPAIMLTARYANGLFRVYVAYAVLPATIGGAASWACHTVAHHWAPSGAAGMALTVAAAGLPAAAVSLELLRRQLR